MSALESAKPANIAASTPDNNDVFNPRFIPPATERPPMNDGTRPVCPTSSPQQRWLLIEGQDGSSPRDESRGARSPTPPSLRPLRQRLFDGAHSTLHPTPDWLREGLSDAVHSSLPPTTEYLREGYTLPPTPPYLREGYTSPLTPPYPQRRLSDALDSTPPPPSTPPAQTQRLADTGTEAPPINMERFELPALFFTPEHKGGLYGLSTPPQPSGSSTPAFSSDPDDLGASRRARREEESTLGDLVPNGTDRGGLLQDLGHQVLSVLGSDARGSEGQRCSSPDNRALETCLQNQDHEEEILNALVFADHPRQQELAQTISPATSQRTVIRRSPRFCPLPSSPVPTPSPRELSQTEDQDKYPAVWKNTSLGRRLSPDRRDGLSDIDGPSSAQLFSTPFFTPPTGFPASPLSMEEEIHFSAGQTGISLDENLVPSRRDGLPDINDVRCTQPSGTTSAGNETVGKQQGSAPPTLLTTLLPTPYTILPSPPHLQPPLAPLVLKHKTASPALRQSQNLDAPQLSSVRSLHGREHPSIHHTAPPHEDTFQSLFPSTNDNTTHDLSEPPQFHEPCPHLSPFHTRPDAPPAPAQLGDDSPDGASPPETGEPITPPSRYTQRPLTRMRSPIPRSSASSQSSRETFISLPSSSPLPPPPPPPSTLPPVVVDSQAPLPLSHGTTSGINHDTTSHRTKFLGLGRESWVYILFFLTLGLLIGLVVLVAVKLDDFSWDIRRGLLIGVGVVGAAMGGCVIVLVGFAWRERGGVGGEGLIGEVRGRFEGGA